MLIEFVLYLIHNRLHIPSSDVHADIDVARGLLAGNLHGPRLIINLCHLAQGYLCPAGQRYVKLAQVVDTLPVSVREPDDQVKPFLTLKHRPCRTSGKCAADIGIEVIDVQTVLRHPLPVVLHRNLRQSVRALKGHILGSLYPTDDAHHPLTQFAEFVEIVAIKFHGHILAHTREQLVETEGHRL